jgi:hypothetical protein
MLLFCPFGKISTPVRLRAGAAKQGGAGIGRRSRFCGRLRHSPMIKASFAGFPHAPQLGMPLLFRAVHYYAPAPICTTNTILVGYLYNFDMN